MLARVEVGESAEMAEYPFVTLTRFSPQFLVHLGGMVSAKSVKVRLIAVPFLSSYTHA
jgi:hypothetical protein